MRISDWSSDVCSSDLYVDGGNKIRYLPFVLALPHRLNAVCLALKAVLESEKLTAVGDKVSFTTIAFLAVREPAAQKFNQAVDKSTTDSAIQKAAAFDDANDTRLLELGGLLSRGPGPEERRAA